MMCSASGTYSLPSAFMKSYWVSTSQKMTRGIPGSLPHNGPGNFSEETGQCQQERQQLDLQPQHHCYLITAILPRAPRAVRPHLERKMPLFGEHEAELVEERGLARQRQHFGDSAGPCLRHQGVHQGPAHAGALLIRPHRQPGHLGQIARVDLERAASHELPVGCLGDQILLDVPAQIVVAARQQVARGDVGSHERLEGRDVGERRPPEVKADPRPTMPQGTAPRSLLPKDRQRAHARISSRIVVPRSSSSDEMTSGGTSRSTFAPAVTTSSPRSRAAVTYGAAGSPSSRPHISPRPRTSFTFAERAASRASRAPSHSPFCRTAARKSGWAMVRTTSRATLATRGPPPNVVAWSPGLSAPAIASRRSTAPMGRPPPGEQASVEAAAEGNDFGLSRPLAGELERGLVRFGARVAEEDPIGERPRHQLLGQPLGGLGAIQIRDVNEPGSERVFHGRANHRMVVTERVDPDASDEVEVAGAVLRDERGAVPGDEAGTDRGVHAKQRAGRRRRRGRGCRGHAALTAGGRIRVPAEGCASRCQSPIRTAWAPARMAVAAARSLAAMPSVAAPSSMRVSISPAATDACTVPSTVTPGTSDTNSSSVAWSAPATAAAASSALTLKGRPPSAAGAIGAMTGVSPASSKLWSSDTRTATISPTCPRPPGARCAVNRPPSTPESPMASSPARRNAVTSMRLTGPASTISTASATSGVVTRRPSRFSIGSASRRDSAVTASPPPCTSTTGPTVRSASAHAASHAGRSSSLPPSLTTRTLNTPAPPSRATRASRSCSGWPAPPRP